jgi:hypothetical protein
MSNFSRELNIYAVGTNLDLSAKSLLIFYTFLEEIISTKCSCSFSSMMFSGLGFNLPPPRKTVN